jgi:succinate-semialdehyde dehydrogenase / glutarate-semialdehyde dehydrogenase
MLQKTSHYMRQANLIGGKWVQADSGATIDVINPANGQKLGTVPKSGAAETRRAIEAADDAFQGWRKTSALERSKLLRKLHDAIMDNQDSLAELLTMEQGKALFEAKGEVAISAAYILWFAEEGRRTYGDVVPSPWADRRIITIKQPVGVIAAITPWNFPSSMLARKIGPALAAGCTAVVKPASQTPYSGLAWLPRGRRQHRHRFGRRDRRRNLRQSAGAQADLHRLDGDRQDPDPEMRLDRQEGIDGTRR